METFTSNAETWLNQQDHIGDEHPARFGLLQAAAQLDERWTTSLWAEYNKTIRYIESLKPEEVTTQKVDPLLVPVAGLETRDA